MYRVAVAFCIALVLLAGCGEQAPKEEPKPAEPPPPPEPTADEIYLDLKRPIEQFWRPLTGGAGLSFPEIDAAVANLRTAKSSHAAHKNLPEGTTKLKRDIEQLIKKSQEEDRWRCVLGGCGAYEVLEPGSTRFKKSAELAKIMLARPKVWVNGFSTVDDQTYVMFMIEDRDTNELKPRQARVGEELIPGTVRVEEIIGGQQSVRLNYLPINDSDWVVPGPSEKRKSNRDRGDLE